MEYHQSQQFTGNVNKALGIAQNALLQAGYKIITANATTISAEQSGGFTKSQSGSTLYGASPIQLRIEADSLILEADFQGIERMKTFLIKLLCGLGILLGFGLGIPFGFIFDEKWPMLLGIGLGVGIPLIQLPIHLLVTPYIMKKRATNALDILVHNIQILAGDT